MQPKSKIWYLEKFNFFKELTEGQRIFVHANSVMKTIRKNEAVYFQEDPSNSIYFLKAGKIRISRFSAEGKELLMDILEPGEIFGESAILSEKKRKETAIAEDNVVYCVMNEANMKELLLRIPQLNLRFSQMLENRREKEQKRLQDLSFKTNQQRIIDFIKRLIAEAPDSLEIKLDKSLTHEKIAKLTSTNRQEVSGILSKLKKDRIIDYNRHSLRILNPQELELF